MSSIDSSQTGPISDEHKVEETSEQELLAAYMSSYFLTTMSSSERQKFVSAIIDSNPQLPPPHVNVADFIGLAQNKIIKDQLDSWGKAIEQQKERRREWLNSAAYQKELDLKSVGQREKDEVKLEANTATTEGFKHAINNYLERLEKPTVDDVMIIGTGVTALTVGTVGPESTNILGTHAIQDAVSQTVSPLIQQQFQDSAQLTINLFVVGLATSIVAEAAFSTTKQTDQEFARSYGEKILKKVADPDDPVFNFLNVFLLEKTAKGEKASPDMVRQIATIAKLVMLSVALLLIYKLTPQYIKEGGFEGLLNGSIELEEGSIEEKLAAEINKLINQFPPEKREAVRNSILAFAGLNPSIEDLITPYKGTTMAASMFHD